MTIVRLHGEPRYFLRPGATDHHILDTLLTPDMFSDPIRLDGVLLESPHANAFADARAKLPRGTQVLVDPQVYRFQRSTYQEHPSLSDLPYYPVDSALEPEQFKDNRFVSKFVRAVLDVQDAITATDFVVPGFYVDDPDSPWQWVNEALLSETRRQAGGSLYATLCGSYTTLCKPGGATAVAQRLGESGAEGVLLLASPFAAIAASPTKLLNYLLLLKQLDEAGLAVIAGRQPAFGLGCMAFGIAGFDSGVATAERFDYAALTRTRKTSSGKQKRPARKRRIYLDPLLTSVPYSVAEQIFSTSGLAGSFVCREPCCRDGLNGALLRSRDHFIYTRLREVDDLRGRPREWRAEHFRQKLEASRQMALKVARALPEARPDGFRHLEIWLRVFTELQARMPQRALAGV
jgi:hypothetical protein